MANETATAVGSAAVTALGNYAVQAASNKRQFKYQKQAMEIQQQYNKDLWDYQNAYNTPQQQMERLKAAGLNPYLIYGGGSANMGNAGAIVPTEVPSRHAATPSVPDLANTYLNARQRDIQYEATKQTIENQQRKAALLESQTALENLKLMRENLRAKNYDALNKAEKDTAEYVALRAGELFNLTREQANEKWTTNQSLSERMAQGLSTQKLENEFRTHRNALSKMGIYSSDHPLFRVALAAANRMGVPLDELLNKGYSYLKSLLP